MKIGPYLMTSLMVTIMSVALAQPGDPGDPGGGPGGGQPVPLGGIEILVAAAILLGIKKIWDVQRSRKNVEEKLL